MAIRINSLVVEAIAQNVGHARINSLVVEVAIRVRNNRQRNRDEVWIS